MNIKKTIYIVAGLLLLAAIGYSFLKPDPIEPVINNSFAKYLEEDGYTIWPMPDSISNAGAIVTFRDDGKANPPTSTLKSCGVPENVLQTQEGLFPQITIKDENSFGVNLLGSIGNLKGNADFTKIGVNGGVKTFQMAA